MIIEGEAKSAVALWRAVIAQAMQDATMLCGSNALKQLELSRARSWLLTPNPNFNEVCALADLEPTQVRTLARMRITEADAKQVERNAAFELRSERIRRGHEVRRAKRAGVVANFPKNDPDRTFPTAQETT